MTLLPSEASVAAPPRASSAADRKNGLRTLRALIVDDNRHMRRLLHTLLGAYGIKDVHEARDGTSGIAILKAAKPDFVLTDYDMQPVNGIAFVKMVRRTCSPPLSWVPIIMIPRTPSCTGSSSRATPGSRRRCASLSRRKISTTGFSRSSSARAVS